MNAELMRNLWLELTPGRLIAAPVVIGLVLALGFVVPHWAEGAALNYVDWVARWGGFALLSLYGSRLAADSVASEISGRTWDAQRLSALGAWSMSLGKIFGSTAFAWYCALCLIGGAGILVLNHLMPVPEGAAFQLESVLGGGLAAQVVAFCVGLVLLRGATERSRLAVGLAQIAGIVTGYLALETPDGTVGWYGVTFSRPLLALDLVVAIGALSFVGAISLLRAELALVDRPWAWLGFVVAVAAIAAGFGPIDDAVAGIGRLARGAQVVCGLAWVGLLFGAMDARLVWRVGHALRHFRLLDALRHLPAWLAAWLLGLGALGYIWANDGFEAAILVGAPFHRTAAMLLLMLRDAAIVLALSDERVGTRRGLAAALVVLVLLYVVLPVLLRSLGAPVIEAAFWPVGPNNALSLVLPAAEAFGVWALLILRARLK